MKCIKLTQGKYALVDDEDYEQVNKRKWYVSYDNKKWYARRNITDPSTKKRIRIRMHREIMDCPKGLDVDHVNHNGLDNRKCNLRICTHSQNLFNQLPRRTNTTSKYKGVYWNKKDRRWRASIGIDGKQIYIGNFSTEIKAAEAYGKKAKELFGEFAYLNLPPKDVIYNKKGEINEG